MLLSAVSFRMEKRSHRPVAVLQHALITASDLKKTIKLLQMKHINIFKLNISAKTRKLRTNKALCLLWFQYSYALLKLCDVYYVDHLQARMLRFISEKHTSD